MDVRFWRLKSVTELKGLTLRLLEAFDAACDKIIIEKLTF